MRINKSDFVNILDKINLLDYKIDYNRNQNYFFYKGYKTQYLADYKILLLKTVKMG